MADPDLTRRRALSAMLSLGSVLWSSDLFGFGQQGAFNPRLLQTAGTTAPTDSRVAGLAQWSWELIRRTSAPGRLHPETVAADGPDLLAEPFCVWAGERAVEQLSPAEQRGLRGFFELGGVLFVDDAEPAQGEFGRSVRFELSKVLPEVPLSPLPERHVVYKSYYLVDRPVGRVQGPPVLEAMMRGQKVQVLLSSHDLLGALARD
jgi:hypothetical protein